MKFEVKFPDAKEWFNVTDPVELPVAGELIKAYGYEFNKDKEQIEVRSRFESVNELFEKYKNETNDMFNFVYGLYMYHTDCEYYGEGNVPKSSLQRVLNTCL